MHEEEMSAPYITEVSKPRTSGGIKMESLEEDIQEVNNAIELLNDSTEINFKELNKKISEVRTKTTEDHAKLNKKMIEVSNRPDSERADKTNS